MSNPTIDRFMTANPVCIDGTEPLGEAVKLMRKRRLRHLPVLHEGALVGVLSDREIDRLESVEDSHSLTAREAMATPAYVVFPEDGVAEVARRMAREKIGAAVVLRGARVVGIFTTTDALRALADLI